MNMNAWTIPGRVTFGFVLLVLLSLLLGSLSLWRVLGLNDNVQVMATNTLPSVVTLNRIMQRDLMAARAARRAMLDATDNSAGWRTSAAALESVIQEGDALCATYQSLFFDDRDRQLFEAAKTARDGLVAVVRQSIALLEAGKLDESRLLLRDQLEAVVQESMSRFNMAVEYNTAVGQAQVDNARREVRLSYLVIGVLLALTLALAGVLGAAIIRSTSRALRAVSETLESSAAQTATASGQLSSVSQALAAGCSEQGSSVVQTSAALEEMSTMIRSTADNAARAKELATQARSSADVGARSMAAMNEAMNAIEVSSGEVAKIVKNIDEIAFQTNILALNAAVEAARAGEAGAGFAVVADEVRSLAQRSAAAARESAERIDAAIASSRHGLASCRRVEEALGDIAEKVTAADNLVAEIATAAREQTHGIKQIGIAMTQMDGVTRGNAARAEESSSAATELNSQAHLMQESVEFLRSLVSRGDTGVTRRGPSVRTVATVAAPPAADARARRPVLPAPQRIPLPDDTALTHDEEDRNFKNF